MRLEIVKSKSFLTLGYFPPSDDRLQGEDIISKIMPKNYGVYHIDSHDTEDGKYFRFQGVVTVNSKEPPDDNPWIVAEMPLSVLCKAASYSLILNSDHVVWTVYL